MLAWIKRKRNAAAVAVIAVALVVGYGVSAAQAVLLPSGHHTWGSFAACIAKSNGAMRLVGANASACKSTETPVKWNSAGSPNGTGKTGPKGDTGAAGDKGDAGEQGLKGDPGADSTVPGPKGEKGDAGDAGAPGAKGEQGADGKDGVVNLEVDGLYKVVQPTEDGKYAVVTAKCADGKYATGGGFSPEDGFPFDGVTVIASRPSVADGQFEEIPGDPEGSVRSTAWELWITNTADAPRNVRPWVVCAEIASAE